MYYYEAPNQGIPTDRLNHSLFMAGGITDCPNWQMELREKLINTDVTLLNPRRANFPIDDPNAAEQQITWEHNHLHLAKAVSFWFPAETLSPIVLFELGAWSHWQGHRYDTGQQRPVLYQKPIFVGVHPDYKRRQDVEIQLLRQRPEVEVVYSLDDLAWQIAKWSEEKK
jgi:hypothetical protein